MTTKDAVLAFLEKDRGRFVSGPELAEKLSLSRTAVWKAIRALEAEGHEITAVKNKGYRLETGSDRLSAAGISACLPEKHRIFWTPVRLTPVYKNSVFVVPQFEYHLL